MPPTPEGWDYEGLAREVKQMGLEGEDLDADGLESIGVREDILEHLREAFDQSLEEREKKYGPEVWAQVERLVLLRTIDQLWVDHLTELDDMRRGIGLRGYGGTDPLNEFKREAFKLYEELRGFISKQVANTIFHVQITPAPAPPGSFPMAAAAGSPFAATEGGGNGAQSDQITPVEGGHVHTDGTFHADGPPAAATKTAAAATAAAVVPGLAAQQRRGVQLQHGDEAVPSGSGAPASAAKLGRNDLCWCGSGKKFKRCHGA